MHGHERARRPLRRFVRGFTCPFEAAGMILRSRRMVLLSLAPFLIGLVVYAALFLAALVLVHNVVDAIVAPGAWWRTVVRTALMIGLPVALLGAMAFTYTVFSFILAGPLYELLSVAVERDVTGALVELPSGFLTTLGDAARSAGFAVFVLLLELWVIAFGLLLVPFTTIIAFGASAFLLALGYCDYPMARRRMRLTEKFRFARRHFYEFLGLGLPLMLGLLIPFFGAAFLALGVAGGTILFLRLAGEHRAEAGGRVDRPDSVC